MPRKDSSIYVQLLVVPLLFVPSPSLLRCVNEVRLVEQIKYSDNAELVSSDIMGTSAAAVVDVPATIVRPDGKGIVLYVWYDNEYGYTHQVMRLARHIAGVRRFTYY
ncbi:hypothetical protein [Sphingobacterium sp. SGG-5]|uniref:hypothetical protein n=1 Tax=Sphingobacterium sp. SGG-5 TaxID=2710881 RepID=UPI001F108532|nr:hypothetical protein [Sphingobacterium sp. SGG-5]